MSETTYYKYISNGDHYTDVITKLSKVEHHLWIGTADIKDLYVKSGSTTIPFLKVISQLIERGVEVRLIHAKEPGPNFRKDFDKYPILSKLTIIITIIFTKRKKFSLIREVKKYE